MAELDITRVDKIYHSRKGDVHAVKALDLVVKPGEIVALLGSSGCGKTSTLRMIAGFEEVSNGSFGKYTTHIRFLALHGLRWSEAVALTVEDIRDDRVWINKSVHGQTKSKAGIRSVPLVSPFKLFPKSPKTLRKVLKPYGVDIHSLRHTYAYLLKQQGVHVTTAQRLLGHSDPRVTLNVYTQVLDNEIDDVGLLLSKAAGF